MTALRAAVVGTGGGLLGGVAFGAAMLEAGVLPTVAGIVHADSTLVGALVHLVIAALLGAGFGLLTRGVGTGAGETLIWGVTYGVAWWFLGALTLLPLFLGRPVSWEVTAAQDELPSLFGHLLYGATLAAGVVLLRGRATGPHVGPRRRGGLGSGAAAGLGAAVLLGAGLRSQDGLASATRMVSDGRPGLAWPTVLVVGLTAGLLYAALFPAPRRGSGPALVRGAVFGFLCWTFGAQTLLPLLSGEGLGWSVAEARAGFSALPAYLLFGTALGLGFAALTAVVDGLLSDRARTHDREGPASRSLRAVGQGAVAGLAGGAIFTVVMVVTGYLPTVARLVGSDSQVTGVAVHLVISFLIGASYGLLFRRQSYDDGSALGWGVAYGFVWWFLGALTLLPILLGGSPQWSAAAVAETFPSLIGHLAYGAALGLTYVRLETRVRPWWLSRSEAETVRAYAAREQLLSSAPALWAFVVLIALTMPVLVGR